jgi:prepilin-type N-terminal cleavage/methylation domain-containing protein
MRKAFTIVELLVVMAVISILISLAVVGIQAIQKSQRELSRQNDIRNIAGAMAEYYAKNRVYPLNYSWFSVGSDNKSICFYAYPTGWYPGIDS